MSARAQSSEPLAAELLGDIDLPQADLLAACDQMLLDLRLEVRPFERLAFERNQFPVDEPAHGILQEPKLLGDFEIHFASPLSLNAAFS